MTMSSQDLSLAGEFPPATPADWRKLALNVLRKARAATEDTPLEAVDDLLTTTTYDGVPVRALYTADDGLPDVGMPGFAPFIRDGRAAGSVHGGWDVRQSHADPDPTTTAAAINADLAGGVTSVWLAVGEGRVARSALPEVLDQVDLSRVGVVLDAGADAGPVAEEYLAHAAARGVAAGTLSGTFGVDPLGSLARTGKPDTLDEAMAGAAALAARCSADHPRLRAITVDATPYHDAGGSDAQELGAALATGVAYLRALTGAGLDVPTALGQLEFRYAATADQFLTIAKLRAARRLWARVAEVCGAADAGAQHLHAVTSAAMMSVRDPWVNMLRGTLACFAAAVGGADAVTVLPFDHSIGLPDEFSRRIARNTQALLLEEAHIGRVIDPAGGSWYVEQLTEDLAGAAWDWFTEIERAGGAEAGLRTGLIAGRLAATWDARVTNLAHRRDPLTGISEFPNLDEQLPVRPPAAQPPVGDGLPRHRYAEVFESRRDRCDAHSTAAGSRPTVFLATLGPVSAHTARATFAANLFAAGGIATSRSGPISEPAEAATAFDATGATVACICGTDKAYAALAGPVAEALVAAGAKRVWLAGAPGQYPGVDSYLHLGCDAVSAIDATLRDLGVA